PELERSKRRQQPVLGELAALGDADDHSEELERAKGDDEHRSRAAALCELARQAVVERSAQRARARERLDVCDLGHPAEARSATGGSAQRVGLVGALPREVVVFAAEMAIRGGLLVD